MLFETDFTVETTHTVENKVKTTLKVTHGVIHQLEVYFPPGCAHLVRVALNEGGHQIFPTNPDGYIKGDGVLVKGTDFQPVIEPPFEVDIYGWSVGASYEHTITVRLWVLKPWQMMPFSDEMFNLALKEGVG